MTILAGNTVVKDGITYRGGVVPDATVYQTPVVTFDDILTGVEACLQYDVSIINMSLGGLEAPYYSYTDMQIDKYVRENNLVIVVSAGNEGNGLMSGYKMIRTPGRALNAITVGNAKTKTDINEVLIPPYPISNDSCFFEPEYSANKPDLVAPGWVTVLMHSFENVNNPIVPHFDHGTSYSAPIVAGIAAQIIENDPIYNLNPMFVKAALLIGADLSLMDTSNDTQSTTFFYNKCGAGMVNAMNSIQSNIHLEYFGAVTTSVIPMNTYDYYFYTGDRVRAVLTFTKDNEIEIESENDLDDIYLILFKRDYYHGDYPISNSCSPTNNNEIIDVEIPSEGEYYFLIYVNQIADINHPPVVAFEFIHER